MYVQLPGESVRNKHKLEEAAKTLTPDKLTKIILPLEKSRDVWVAAMPIHFPKLTGTRKLAIQLNAPSIEQATEIDYFLTNEDTEVATAATLLVFKTSGNFGRSLQTRGRDNVSDGLVAKTRTGLCRTQSQPRA